MEAINHDRQWITRHQQKSLWLFSIASRLRHSTVLLGWHHDRRVLVLDPIVPGLFMGCLAHDHGSWYLLRSASPIVCADAWKAWTLLQAKCSWRVYVAHRGFSLVADIVRKLAALEFVRPIDKEHIHMSTRTRLRPLGETSGSDQRPPRELTGAAMKF